MKVLIRIGQDVCAKCGRTINDLKKDGEKGQLRGWGKDLQEEGGPYPIYQPIELYCIKCWEEINK